MLQALEKFDIFPQKFSFNFRGAQEGRRNFIGGLLSACIVLLSLVYLLYLLAQWGNHQFPPTITSM